MDQGALKIEGTHTIDSLTINAFQLTGPGTLNVGTLAFNYGKLGGTSGAQGGGTLNVTGVASLNGVNTLDVDYNYTLNLNGDSRWTAGNGRLVGAGPSSAGAGATFVTAAGTTFTDEGAATAAGYKIIAGLDIQGSYLRTGLGTTYARNVNLVGTLTIASGDFIFDTGNFTNTSNGTISVAAGSTLGLSNITFTSGSIVNHGLVRQVGGTVTVGSNAQIGGAWVMDQGELRIEGAHTVDSLTINAFRLTGPGTLNVGTLAFNYGKLGGTSGAQGGGTLNVIGATTLNGSSTLDADFNYTLNLNGDSRWTAGDGRLAVAGNTGAGPGRINIAAGTTFTDEGAASASGEKVLVGSGLFTNNGTYTRTGFGTTVAMGFRNPGTLQIDAGTMAVDGAFSNTGRVEVAAGALLWGYAANAPLVNAGTLGGDGTVKTYSASTAVVNHGTIDPGAVGQVGTLTIDGKLTLTDSGVLHIDLASGAADKLVITGDALLDGELALWSTPGLALQTGATYTLASFSQRLSGSSFDSITWHGLDASQFTVEYTADSVLLHVTSAVPEPASWVMALAGLLAVGGIAHRRAASA